MTVPFVTEILCRGCGDALRDCCDTGQRTCCECWGWCHTCRSKLGKVDTITGADVYLGPIPSGYGQQGAQRAEDW